MQGAKHDAYRVVTDGVPVRFVEHSHSVQAFEGRLSDARLAALQAATLATLEHLDASPCLIEPA